MWIGYVTHVEKTVEGSLDQPMMVHCVGASYPLKEKATRTFQNMTIPEVAALIGREFGLTVIADSHPIRFPQLTMAGHSYWEWLVEQSKKIGYSMYVDGAVLHFERFDRAISRKSSDAALLFYNGKYLPPRARHVDRTLHSFKALKGDHIETSGAMRSDKVAAGVNPLTARSTSEVSSPANAGLDLRTDAADVFFTEYRSDLVVQSVGIAKELAKGAASMARFNIPAKVKCIGDPRISPFIPVQVVGTGAKTDGLWVAQKVRHNIRSNGEYDIEAVVLTDGTGVNTLARSRTQVIDQVGTINIVEAIKGGGKMGTQVMPVVRSAAVNIRPADVGFNKDKARWRAGGINGR
jgi:phage protein D